MFDSDEIADLMSEPAGGDNHGWHRNSQGGWTSLEPTDLVPHKEPTFVARDYHGREYGYRKMKCRCVLCRAWKSMDNAARYRQIQGLKPFEEDDRGS